MNINLIFLLNVTMTNFEQETQQTFEHEDLRTGYVKTRPTNIILTRQLIKDPTKFLDMLVESDVESEQGKNITYWLNSTDEYGTWFSTGPQILLYLCGDRTQEDIFEIEHTDENFMNKEILMNEGIHYELAINIFNEMLRFNPDLTIRNYYGDDLNQCIIHNQDTLTVRIYGENLHRHIEICIKLINIGIDISQKPDFYVNMCYEPMLFANYDGSNFRELTDWFWCDDLNYLKNKQHPDLKEFDVMVSPYKFSNTHSDDVKRSYIQQQELLGVIMYPEDHDFIVEKLG